MGAGRDRFGKIFLKKLSDQILTHVKVVYTFYLLTNSSRVLNRRLSTSGEPFGVLFAPQRRAAPHLGRGGSERRPGPSPRDEDLRGEGRGGTHGMLGLVVGPPLLLPSLHAPLSTPHPLANARVRGVANVHHRTAWDHYPCNPTIKRASLQDTGEQPMEPVL